MKRFSKKLDSFFWFLILILPIVIYITISFNVGNSTDFSTFISSWTFPFISDIFNDIFTGDLLFNPILVDYISYCVSVEIIHVFFDVVVFIPRLAHKLSGRFIDYEK
jgi:ABC-type spermidine/putrescine transport system permease subunit II